MVGELGRENNESRTGLQFAIDKCLSPRNRNRTWLIKYYFFYFQRNKKREVLILKEIGEKLKETRESIGVSIEEASEDLKMRPSQLENIEAGNMEAFKDVFSLKYFIRDYSKYLGLDYEDMIDDYNEYLFDYTSKLSLDDIKKAKKKMSKKETTKRIASPYTMEKKKFQIPPIVIYLIILLAVLLIGYFTISFFNHENDDFVEDPVVMNVDY